VVLPSQIVLAPEIAATGFELTVTIADGGETQLVDVWVKVKNADPGVIPVTVPSSVTEATPGLELTHVPPVVGLKVVVVPLQIDVPPVTFGTGSAFTVINPVALETQLVALSV